MSGDSRKIRWAPRVRPEKLRQLYLSDARGLLDLELLEDVGITLYCRCESILVVSDAAEGKIMCAQCGAAIDRVRDDKDQKIACFSCGWTIHWSDYQKSYQHMELYARGLTEAIHEFIRGWERATNQREKMLLVDRLIHVWHWENRDDHPIGRPACVNLIEGSRRQVLQFLDELSALKG
jgi:DNA-directed RNA polymerase subunit N (RpoN/RPB10)